MRIMVNVGSLDGKSMIEMNNLSVGYFPGDTVEVGVYPPPVPPQPEEHVAGSSGPVRPIPEQQVPQTSF